MDIKVYEAPIGASVSEILGIAGLDVENSSHLSVIDGGPYLHDMAIEELGTGDAYVRRMTNALLLLPKGRQGKEYADIETEPPNEGIVSLVGKISGGVHLPLGGGLLKPATPLVSEGDEVEYEQKIGEPVDEGFSIGVWASVGGEISIENDIVAIAGGAIPQEEAEAEAEASIAGGAQPRGEAEPFQEAEAETSR
jgi:electron transport complex protein RnfC